MTRVTVRRLHEETGKLVDEAAAGDVIVVERRGKPIAELRPLSTARPAMKIPDFDRRYAKYPHVKTDSGRFLEKDRR